MGCGDIKSADIFDLFIAFLVMIATFVGVFRMCVGFILR